MRKLVWAGLVCWLGLGRAAWAEDEPPPARYSIGFVELHPAVQASSVYDDNIFKVNDRVAGLPVAATSDLYFTANPRFSLRVPFERSFISAGYGYQAVKYSNVLNKDVDTTIWDTFNTHTAFAEANLRLGRGLAVGLRDDFQRKNLFITSIDLTTVNPSDRDAMRPIGQYHNEVKPAVTYRFEDSNLDLDTGYGLDSDRFIDSQFVYLNKDIHVPRGKVSYRFFPKTAGFVEGEGYLVRYLKSSSAASFAPLDKRNANGWKAWAGAQGLVTSRLTAVIAGGWGRLAYARVPGLAAASSENADTWLARFELNEKYSERMKLTLGASRDFFDSYSTNFYTSSRAYAEVWRSLNPNFALVVGGNLFRNHYSRPYARHDWGYLGSLKLEMRPSDMAWMKVNLGYTREQRASSFDWYTYRANQVFTEATAEF